MARPKKAALLAVQSILYLTSISETELCVRWGKCPRSLQYWRKARKTPAHFLYGKQVRYLLSDIEAFEKEKRGSLMKDADAKTQPQYALLVGE